MLIAAGLVAVAAAWRWRSEIEAGGGGVVGELATVSETVTRTISDTASEIMNSITGYTQEKVPSQYRAAIATAETANGIPDGMLARLLWQESRYRPEIIDGRKTSPVGALGIAQFMPATAAEWGVDPLDAFSSIAGAGRYLAWLFKQTGAWDRALAAYNWGVGNVNRKGLERAPAETRNYFSQILADIGLRENPS